MTRVNDDQIDTPSGQVCWLWWAAESEETRQLLLEAMVGEPAGQPLDAGAARQLLAAAG